MSTTNESTRRSNNVVEVPNKVFKPRDSPLTELLRDKNIKSIYNTFPGIFLITLLYSVLKDYEREGRAYFGTRLIRSAFSQFDVALIIWIGMFMSSLCVYYIFLLWAYMKKYKTQNVNGTFGAFYLLYVIGMVYYSSKMVVSSDLGVASSLAVMMEMTRLVMKSYAFIRSNCTRRDFYPTFGHYLYFSFAPTLVYADNYPRSNGRIRWCYAISRFVQVTLLVFFYSIIFENTYIYNLKDYGLKNYTTMDLSIIVVQYSVIAHIILILFSFACHSYLNGTSELLRFSDRLFYKDWWTADGVDEYLRKWNTFIYDWLYVYVYKDCYNKLFPGRKYLARLIVLVLSAVFHDLIVCVSCRFYLPVISFQYIILIIFSRHLISSNKVILSPTGILVSCMFTLYITEYYARINCPIPNPSLLESIKPRFLHC